MQLNLWRDQHLLLVRERTTVKISGHFFIAFSDKFHLPGKIPKIAAGISARHLRNL